MIIHRKRQIWPSSPAGVNQHKPTELGGSLPSADGLAHLCAREEFQCCCPARTAHRPSARLSALLSSSSSALHGRGSSCSLFPPTADTSTVKASSLWLGKKEDLLMYLLCLPLSPHTPEPTQHPTGRLPVLGAWHKAPGGFTAAGA